MLVFTGTNQQYTIDTIPSAFKSSKTGAAARHFVINKINHLATENPQNESIFEMRQRLHGPPITVTEHIKACL